MTVLGFACARTGWTRGVPGGQGGSGLGDGVSCSHALAAAPAHVRSARAAHAGFHRVCGRKSPAGRRLHARTCGPRPCACVWPATGSRALSGTGTRAYARAASARASAAPSLCQCMACEWEQALRTKLGGLAGPTCVQCNFCLKGCWLSPGASAWHCGGEQRPGADSAPSASHARGWPGARWLPGRKEGIRIPSFCRR